LYVEIDVIASNYTGWTFSEIRAMSGRQRKYFLAMISWKQEKARG
jgi:Holliday junction resolvase-like predicted endonuclease